MWGKMLDELVDGLDDNEELFNEWEQAFIESINSQTDFKLFSDLTFKQRDKLEDLWKRLNAQGR